MSQPQKTTKRKTASRNGAEDSGKSLNKQGLTQKSAKANAHVIPVDPAAEEQLKQYEEALEQFQGQKYAKAKVLFEKALTGPSRECADRARVHLRIVDQRLKPAESPT